MLLKLFHQTHPDLSTMLIFSASVLIPYFRFLYAMRFLCPELCPTDVTFSFLGEIILWFVVLYALKRMLPKRA
jgi:uncharacterized membrane protein (GlpM family)